MTSMQTTVHRHVPTPVYVLYVYQLVVGGPGHGSEYYLLTPPLPTLPMETGPVASARGDLSFR